MVRLHLIARMKRRRHRAFLFCSIGLCLLSFLHYYKALHQVPLLRELSDSKFQLRVFAQASSILWGEKGCNNSLCLILKSEPNEQDYPEPGDSEQVTAVNQDAVEHNGLFMPDPTGFEGDLHRRSHLLDEDLTPYFIRTPKGAVCFGEGTDVLATDAGIRGGGAGQDHFLDPGENLTTCVCRPGWHGPHCGIPTVVQHSNLPFKSRVEPRLLPRRVINAININHEIDLLHTRFHELADAVDLFLICESNYTAYGDARPVRFLHHLLNGTFKYVKHKILYVFLDHFPKGGKVNGWIADDYLRTFLSQNGLSRVKGLRPDDLFLINDADEIPLREGILFLKLYDGWTEPVGIHMRKSLYGFYWKEPGSLDVISACSVAMLTTVYQGNGILLRRRHYYSMPGFREYENSTGQVLMPWSIGSPIHYAGWHCSWCFRPKGIYVKLVSAQNGDFPRWGDFEEKRKLSYIKQLIRTGGWFDGSLPNYPPADPKEHMFAPKYLLRNYNRYRYLLENLFTEEGDSF